MNIGRHLLIERCHYDINSKISLQRKAYEEKAFGYMYHVHCLIDCYSLQENRDKMQVGVNIMLTFRGNLQQLGPPSKKLNVGGS